MMVKVSPPPVPEASSCRAACKDSWTAVAKPGKRSCGAAETGGNTFDKVSSQQDSSSSSFTATEPMPGRSAVITGSAMVCPSRWRQAPSKPAAATSSWETPSATSTTREP